MAMTTSDVSRHNDEPSFLKARFIELFCIIRVANTRSRHQATNEGYFMAIDYEEYERECERVKEENKAYLEMFEASLEEAGLSDKTISRHVFNIDFYINEYLLRYDVHRMPEGTVLVSSFLGDWFIRKCMWSSPSSIKQYIASFKKFYKCMLAADKISAADYAYLLETIKEEKDDWIDECEAFDSGAYSWGW